MKNLQEIIGNISGAILDLLYWIRDFVGNNILFIEPAMDRWPEAFRDKPLPDIISLSRVVLCATLLVFQPEITSLYCTITLIWGGVSDWLDGLIYKLMIKKGLNPTQLTRFSGKLVDPGCDAISFEFAIIYLVLAYPSWTTFLLLLATLPDISKIPLVTYGRHLHSEYLKINPECSLKMTEKKLKVGVFKVIFLFTAITLTYIGLYTNQQGLLNTSIWFSLIALVLGYISLGSYTRRFAREYEGTKYWYKLASPKINFWLVKYLGWKDLAKMYPPSTE